MSPRVKNTWVTFNTQMALISDAYQNTQKASTLALLLSGSNSLDQTRSGHLVWKIGTFFFSNWWITLVLFSVVEYIKIAGVKH